MAYRIGILIAAAVVLVALTVVLINLFSGRTLAQRSIQTATGEVIELRIRQEGDDIYASAWRRGGGGTTLLLGSAQSLGTEASITLDETAQQVRLRAGERAAIFELNSNKLYPAR